jgi:hypothetical protein
MLPRNRKQLGSAGWWEIPARDLLMNPLLSLSGWLSISDPDCGRCHCQRRLAASLLSVFLLSGARLGETAQPRPASTLLPRRSGDASAAT